MVLLRAVKGKQIFGFRLAFAGAAWRASCGFVLSREDIFGPDQGRGSMRIGRLGLAGCGSALSGLPDAIGLTAWDGWEGRLVEKMERKSVPDAARNYPTTVCLRVLLGLR